MPPWKIKQPVILPAKRTYSETAEELQFRTCRLWQTIGKSREQGEEGHFTDQRGSWKGSCKGEVHGREGTLWDNSCSLPSCRQAGRKSSFSCDWWSQLPLQEWEQSCEAWELPILGFLTCFRWGFSLVFATKCPQYSAGFPARSGPPKSGLALQ